MSQAAATVTVTASVTRWPAPGGHSESLPPCVSALKVRRIVLLQVQVVDTHCQPMACFYYFKVLLLQLLALAVNALDLRKNVRPEGRGLTLTLTLSVIKSLSESLLFLLF